MFIFAMISGAFVLAAIILSINRLLFDQRFSAIQQEPDQTVLFRRKVNYLKKIEQERHFRYLFTASLSIGLGLVIFIATFAYLVTDYQHLKYRTGELQERIQHLEKEQVQLAKSIPLKNYPKEGIGVTMYEWRKLTAKTIDPELQGQIEDDLSQRLYQYVGTSNAALSLVIPKTLALHLEAQTEDRSSQEIIKSNIDAFAKEAEGVPELTQIQVRMILSVGKKKKNIYSVNYSREKSDEAFNKQNVSENNLKNDGGKG